MFVVLLLLIGRFPFVEFIPSLVGIFDVLLNECFIICVAFFKLVENNVEALCFCLFPLGCLSFQGLRNQIEQIEHLRRNKKCIQSTPSHKIQSDPTNTSLKYCKSKDTMWSNIYFQLYYLFSDSRSMKKHPKVILLGDTNVGKTSILQVLLHDTFQDKMSNTLGACFHRYQSDDARGESIKMDIWDTAGQQKFRSLLTLYYKNSDAVVIVFDVNDPSSFKTVDYWARQIDANCDSVPCIVLVGNKIDLRVPNSGVSKEQIGRFLSKRSKWEYIECSAKENFNIKQIFRVVGSKLQDSLAQKEKLAQASKMKIHPSKLRKDNQSTCC